MISIYLHSSKLAIQPVRSEPILLPCLICLQLRMPASLLLQLDSFQRSQNIANFPAIAFPTYLAFAVLTGLQFLASSPSSPILSSSPATPAWPPLKNIPSIAPFAVAPVRGDGECERAVSSFFQQHRTLSFADSNRHFCWLEQVVLLQPQEAIPQSMRLRREVSTRGPPLWVAV